MAAEVQFKDADLLVFLEAVSHIKNEALFLREDTTRKGILENSLKAYLQLADPASDYLNAQEYTAFKASQDDKYVGIGLEIVRGRNGELLGIPYPGSAAEKAGIASGERIKQIDGMPVTGKSMFTLASLARGKPGSIVRLKIQSRSGDIREISIKRASSTVENVAKLSFDKIPVIKVTSFSRNTPRDLAEALRNWKTTDPIVIDLRGNSGGDFNASVDSAMLFLGPGQRIVSIETRRGSKTYTSSNRQADTRSPMYLWQDGETASAAEVFSAALTQNGRASSIGVRTYGKGTKQDIIELSDGAALVLTTGYLRTPDGSDIREKGLTPTYDLGESQPDTGRYVSKLRQLKAASPKSPHESASSNQSIE